MTWINNKFQLFSIGNYIQYPVINHYGKEYEHIYMSIYIPTCITELLSCTAEIKHSTVNQLYLNKILKNEAQRVRWLGSITKSMGMNLSKLQKIDK